MENSASFHSEHSNNIYLPRHEKILELLNEQGSISINNLSRTLNVTEQTIRRDIRKLEEMNLLSRYHGGITKPIVSNEIVNKDIAEREQSFVQEKERIALKVAELIPDCSTIFITIGTTVEKIAQVLISKKKLRVVTDSLRVAAALYQGKDIEVIVPAGTIRPTNGGIEGPKAIADLGEFRADYTITSIGAIDQDGTLLDFNLSEVIAAKTMINNSRHLIIACDHSKFTAAASVRLGHLSQASYLVTDEEPSSEMMNILESNNVGFIKA